MNLWVARKYFFSLNKGSAINVISLITMLGIMFSTIAMIFVLSIFNGFEGLVTDLYKGYTPDLKIESKKGIDNISEIVSILGSEPCIMLDHDDLFLDLTKLNISTSDFFPIIEILASF